MKTMGNGNPLINIGLSKPATVLIEKISDGVGGYFKPFQIRRVARAEADAEKIKASAQIEVTELQQRAVRRFLAEEAKKQDNMESITAKALPDLEEESRPQDVDDDWVANFFDKCRIVSDEEMQTLWAKVLAGEANSPGTYSKRTVNLLVSLDKGDAALFTSLCGFAWLVSDLVPLVWNAHDSTYNDHGITFNSLTHLDDIGLISFGGVAGYAKIRLPKRIMVHYFRTPIMVEFKGEQDNRLDIGKVVLSKVGRQLAAICGARPVEGFLDYVLDHWLKNGLVLSSPYPRAK